ncbi:hypothetical protein JOY44_04005 [Phormidium sp. CLA17]|uniref:hypothetical protein n=1 Tax=Leptolyngbya sp. Cla-17 TaxID=2803751 RepID=UPI0018D9D0A4|nr:hypothetical protein [Leptolyngbya sp. Cla-17]MBM0740788.1 hypothetical protein [Leptolyngbya sp. Cla-17]
MIQAFHHQCGFLLTGFILLSASAKADAQALPPAQIPVPQPANYAICQPPAPSEYLLLIVTRTPDSQTQAQQLLPPNTSVDTCRYLEDTVTRVGGFRTVDRANAWAKYVTETTGLAAFVARPAEIPQGSPTASTSTIAKPQTSTTSPSTTAKLNDSASYSPKPLGVGYAVLVDYQNQPEMAVKARQALGKDVGLVSYGQRPYLLAVYTTDSNAANTTLQLLSDRGFWATLVDSRRVILLRRSVALPATATTR